MMTKNLVLRIFACILFVGWISSCQKPNDDAALTPTDKQDTEDLMVTPPSDDLANGNLAVRDSRECYTTHYGKKVKLGNGYIRTWINVSSHDKPLAIGLEMTEGALENLPQDPEDFAASSFILPLPTPASCLTPYNHMYVNWNVHGHEPPGVYDLPHFDFHFYQSSIAEQTSIPPYEVAPAGFDNLPSLDYLPELYVRTPGGVPAMGTHWGDLRSPEFNGMSFTHTFIYGTYKGKVTFLEPMITHALIKGGTTVLKEIRQPKKYNPTHTYYPTRYAIWKDCGHGGRHYVAIDNFVWR
jgi:Domain of unknown function (DUF5602)